MLRTMLNANRHLFVPHESHFLIDLVRSYSFNDSLSEELQKEVYAIVANHPRFKSWKTSDDALLRILKDSDCLASFIENLYEAEAFANTSSQSILVGEKTPQYVDYMWDFDRELNHPKSVLLYRDGRDVCDSLAARNWEGVTDYQRAKYWRRCVRKMHDFSSLGTSMSCRYEDLVTSTQASLQSICDHLKVEYQEEMLSFYKSSVSITQIEAKANIHAKLASKPSDDDIFKYRKSWSSSRIWRFESIAANELKLAGYEVHRFNSKNPLHQMARFLYMVWGLGFSLLYNGYHTLIPKSLKSQQRRLLKRG